MGTLKFMVCKKYAFLWVFLLLGIDFVSGSIAEDSFLVLHMNFNEQGIINDLSGKTGGGDVIGARWTSDGRFGGAFEFDGIDDYIIIKDLSSDFPGKADTDDFSIAVWVKPDDLRNQAILFKGGNEELSYSLELSSIGFLTPKIHSGESETILFGDRIVESGKWYHVVFVYDFVESGNSIMKAYVNGVSEEIGLDAIRTDAVGPVSNTGEQFIIGTDGKEFFDGSIDEIMVFRKALLDYEIQNIYNNDLFSENAGDLSGTCPGGYFYQRGEGCKFLGYCSSFYSCSALGPCDNGFRDVLCEDIRCGLAPKIEKIECDVDVCVPQYECTVWGECIDGISERKCADLNNCRNADEPLERVACGEFFELDLDPGEFCIPDIECAEWNECEYVDDVEKVFGGIVRLNGLKERSCSDLNKCVKDYIEKEPCESFVSLKLVDEEKESVFFSPGGEVCEGDFLALLFENDIPVTRISLPSWEEGRFDASFLQSEILYCDHCFDGVLNNGEERIDCGGFCKACVYETKKDFSLLIILLWIIAGILFAVFIFVNVYYKLHQ